MLTSRHVADSKAELDALLAGCPDNTLVINQRRNIGALAIRRALGAVKPVIYLPGSAEHELAKSFPGIAKTDERDAEILARMVLGMLQTLQPALADNPALDGARIISAQIAQVRKDRTACANALHPRLFESCSAFEVACEMTGTRCRHPRAQLRPSHASFFSEADIFVHCCIQETHGSTM